MRLLKKLTASRKNGICSLCLQMSNDIERIEQLARKMRSAIEAVPRLDLPIGLSDFPSAACTDSALLLGAYFIDSEVEGFVYVRAERWSDERNTDISHAWLARETLVVDITADQFPDGPDSVIVADPSRWHHTFQIKEDTEPCDFRSWSGLGIEPLHHLYALLQKDLV